MPKVNGNNFEIIFLLTMMSVLTLYEQGLSMANEGIGHVFVQGEHIMVKKPDFIEPKEDKTDFLYLYVTK